MLVNGKDYRTVWMEGCVIKTIEQRKLPHDFEIKELQTTKEVYDSIKQMMIRGAPAIGAMGAFGLAQAMLLYKGYDYQAFKEYIQQTRDHLASSRPTAHDLFHGLAYVFSALDETRDIITAQTKAVDRANAYADRSVEACKRIGEYGSKLIKKNMGILTHCNAGALATVDWGTALAPMRIAHQKHIPFFVFVDETRPRIQGANLTAFELKQEGIDFALIADNAAGYYMKKGEIHLIITGTDRVAANGDVANKIGTYTKAVLAKEHNIPMYIAAPTSTIDFSCVSGDDIPIEERDQDEVHYVHGKTSDGKMERVRISPKGAASKNPAFDVTPARYITGLITEYGIIPATQKAIAELKTTMQRDAALTKQSR